MNYFRKNITEMRGYTPGEQPKETKLIKLNTNENPYPFSPKAQKSLQEFSRDLRFYPDPNADLLRQAAADFLGLGIENIIAGNGSDDILTIVMRAFASENDIIAYLEPSYSLYPVLAEIQNAKKRKISLTTNFQLPENILEQIADCKIFFVPNPNAPTGNIFDKKVLEKICQNFTGIILIDEAYADFSVENCINFVKKYENVIISRTLSKSFSLAGARCGFAAAQAKIIEGLFKVKDSYNVNSLTQVIATAALRDLDYMRENCKKIVATRERISAELQRIGMLVLPSQSNFIFVNPQKLSAKDYFLKLRDVNIITRYFPAESTQDFLRITIGNDLEMNEFIDFTKKLFNQI